MCYYDVFGADKTVVRQDYGQICISHCYGSGGIDSLINTKNAVSAVLDYINIDYYISITMAAIDIINDDVGGVEVYIEDDLTALDPSFVQGSTVKLTGHLCEKFVRARSSVTDGTNLMRMSRQKTYMEGFLKRLKELSYDEDIITKIYADTADYVTSNCTIYDMSSILDKLLTYEFLPELSLAGENVEGEEHYEFYLDEDKKVELVQSTFFDLVEDENQNTFIDVFFLFCYIIKVFKYDIALFKNETMAYFLSLN